MHKGRYHTIKELFLAARGVPHDRQGAFLRDACGQDDSMRSEVERLLAADNAEDGFLRSGGTSPDGPHGAAGGSAGSDSGWTTAVVRGQAPERIGDYHLLEKLGEGGMGVVYLAEQIAPVRRRVAVKIMKPGMDSEQVIARFESERQVLALMNHPNVARVLDAGVTGDGRPYFVMEHVPGVPITTYSDKYHLGIEQRLALFIQVCEAIQHAHQNGIIHRDVKPSNVLVTVDGDTPLPKVIDFGVAKAIRRLTDKTIHTLHGQMIGTPAYMSPEQAEFTGLEVDTRTDVYSLGVLLYELMVGALPFPSDLSLAETQRVICETELPRPSVRLGALGDAAQAVARNRRLEVASLERRVRGDLDWIVMKALEKDRTRRYGTASELSQDIRRHLSHEPVQAGPPTAWYRAGKFMRRHRLGVVAGAAVVVALLLGLAGTTTMAVVARQQRDEAARQAKIAQAVNDFLNQDLLAAAAPERQGRDVSVREVVDTASRRIRGKFQDEPLVRAAIHMTLGETYVSLGVYDEAETHLNRALELRRDALGTRLETLHAMNSLTILYRRQGRGQDAQMLCVEALDGCRSTLGEEHPETLRAMNIMALLCKDQGRYEEAERLFLATLDRRRRVLGEEHLKTLTVMNNLALLYQQQGRHQQAEDLYTTSLDLKSRILTDDHPDTIKTMNNLALLYQQQGRYEEAEILYARALQAGRRVLGEDHSDTLIFSYNLGLVHDKQGHHDTAEPLLASAVAGARRGLGTDHWFTGVFLTGQGRCLTRLGRYEQAEAVLLEAQKILADALDAGHRRTLDAIEALVDLYENSGDFDKASELRDRLQGQGSTSGPTTP